MPGFTPAGARLLLHGREVARRRLHRAVRGLRVRKRILKLRGRPGAAAAAVAPSHPRGAWRAVLQRARPAWPARTAVQGVRGLAKTAANLDRRGALVCRRELER